MDRNMFGKKAASDPYVKIYFDNFGEKPIGKTPVKKKTLKPEWEKKIKHMIGINDAERIRHASPSASSKGLIPSFILVLLDYDAVGTNDPLGQVKVPIYSAGMEKQWFDIQPGDPGNKYFCKKAKGKICISYSVETLLLKNIQRGDVLPLIPKKNHSMLQVGLGWSLAQGELPVDLDVSCVAIDIHGKVDMRESVYFANLKNPSGSIVHSGDEREGKKSVRSGSDDREQIMIDLEKLPPSIAAYVLLVTVATPDVTFSQITSTRVRICDGNTGIGFCAFRPAYEGECTAMFCMRMARKRNGRTKKWDKAWNLATIGETNLAGRDFGSLIPEIKGFCRDLFPDLTIDPNERVAVMNKEVTIRVRDYAPQRNVLPPVLAMGLAWDITNGCDIDLDASAVCLDKNYNMVDLVYFKKLRSTDGAIQHSGDEREGDAIGDDEKIIVAINTVDPKVKHIVYVINSYSEQELDDIAMASCHLFDPVNRVDLATYTLTNNATLDKHTALLLADLYRDKDDGDWMMRILSVPSQGKTARRCMGHIVDYLKKVPPSTAASPPNPDVVTTEMPVANPVEGVINFVPDDEDIVVAVIDDEKDEKKPKK